MHWRAIWLVRLFHPQKISGSNPLFAHLRLMATFSQTIKYPKRRKLKISSAPKLNQNPFKKAVCSKVLTISPKKPNSANRCVVKALFTHYKTKLTAKVPGEKHNLQQHSTILVRGAKVRDLIGVSYCVVRGKFDLSGVQNRKTKRSLFGVKKIS
jgi:small subunit ribosomal protein S12